MKFQRPSILSLEIAICLIAMLTISLAAKPSTAFKMQDPTERKPPKQLEIIALSIIAERHNLQPGELEIIDSTISYYRHTGKRVNRFSISHKQRDEDYEIALDDQGKEVDPKALLDEDETARAAKYGKLSPELTEKLKKARPDEELSVIVLLNLPPDNDRPREGGMSSEKLKKMTPEQRRELNKKEDNFEKTRKAYYAERIKRILDPFIERLKQYGVKFKKIGDTEYVALKVPAGMIKEIEGWEEVRSISLEEFAKPALDVSRRTIGANLVENEGINGIGVLVGQVEVGGRIINTFGLNNPYLSGATQDNTFICGGQADEHSVAVAGIIYSQATLPPVFRGISPGAQLWAGGSCTGSATELQNRTNAAIGIGARVINHSYQIETGPNVSTTWDQFLDFRVYNDRRTQVVAAGNQAGTCGNGTGRVTSPGKGYNVITVGNFFDSNTQAWGDDSMQVCSSWVDPASTNGGRIKPEVAAPGTLINTTLSQQVNGQWFDDQFAINGGNISGTSFSAPHVTGEVALLISRAYNTFLITNFHRRCEVIRAIIMASAFNDIENGHSITGVTRDGLGGVSASWADDVLSGFLGGWGHEDLLCSDTYPYEIATFPLQPNLTTRIVIAWSTNPNYPNYVNQPSADLGLRVIDPLGNRVTTVNRFDDTFEWIDFTPTIGGDYRIKIMNRRCDMDPSEVAYAYWQFH